MDSLVIGAGIAGITVARELVRGGHEVTILEARNRIGGRIFTVHEPRLPVPVELGAEFVHGRPPEIWDSVREYALPACEVGGEHIVVGRDISEPLEDVPLDPVFDAMRRYAEPDRTFADFLREWPGDVEAKRRAAGFVEGFNAARKERIGVRSLVQDEDASAKIGGDNSFRILAGYDTIVRFLMPNAARLELNTPVWEVIWKPGSVEVSTDHGNFRAERAVIAVPLGVLQAGTIRWRPEPGPLLAAAKELAMGDVVRVTFLFRERFWENKIDFGFLHSRDPRIPTWWSTLPVYAPMLTGWAAGPYFDQYAGCDAEAIAARARESIAALLRVDTAEINRQTVAWFYHDWHADPWSRGAYSYTPAGALSARTAMAEPVEETLYFCGEATETEGHSGTVHGAIASGLRAARQILGER